MITANIVIIGITGVGKTTVAKIVAHRLGRKFIDLDKMIEQRCEVDIATIFSIEGEAGFRGRETDELSHIVQSDNDFVLSVGGGAVLSAENRHQISQNFVIQLCANIETVVLRLSKSINKRPLFQGINIQQKVIELYSARRVYYDQLSNLDINTSNITPDDAANMIVQYITKQHIK